MAGLGVLCLEDLWRRPLGGGTRLEEVLRAAGMTPGEATCRSPHPPVDLIVLCTLEYCAPYGVISSGFLSARDCGLS